MFWLGLIIGLIIGAPLGIFTIALAIAAGLGDRNLDRLQHLDK
jgi:hypothetical protein